MNLAALNSLPEATRARFERLLGLLGDVGRAAVAFSGGTDSTFLLAACAAVPRMRVVAITCDSELMPTGDLDYACATATGLGVGHVVIRLRPLENPAFITNPPDRCYHCKMETFRACLAAAGRVGFETLLDGRIAGDDLDWRPGTRAAEELGVQSPLREAGLTKEEIRTISRVVFGLPGWDRPSGACLASRFPAGSPVTAEGLAQVRQVEDFLHGLGFRTVRARHLGLMVKIETGADDFARLSDPAVRGAVADRCRAAGFLTVAADLEPYRMGRLNEGVVE